MPADANARDAAPPDTVQLALEVFDDVPESVYVLLDDELDQPGWIRLAHDGESYSLRSRCDCSTCDEPPDGV